MMVLDQLVRRHEETARGDDGKKLDRPTPEGLAKAYGKGIALREQYSEQEIRGFHSEKQRTYQCCAAWLLGAGVPLEGNIEANPNLNMMRVSPEELEAMRNAPTKEEDYRMIFDDYTEQITAAAHNLIEHIDQGVLGGFAFNEKGLWIPCVELNLTHGPVMDAAFAILTGNKVSYETVMQTSGIFDEGEGFDVKLRKENGIYFVDLETKERARTYRMQEFLELAEA